MSYTRLLSLNSELYGINGVLHIEKNESRTFRLTYPHISHSHYHILEFTDDNQIFLLKYGTKKYELIYNAEKSGTDKMVFQYVQEETTCFGKRQRYLHIYNNQGYLVAHFTSSEFPHYYIIKEICQ